MTIVCLLVYLGIIKIDVHNKPPQWENLFMRTTKTQNIYESAHTDQCMRKHSLCEQQRRIYEYVQVNQCMQMVASRPCKHLLLAKFIATERGKPFLSEQQRCRYESVLTDQYSSMVASHLYRYSLCECTTFRVNCIRMILRTRHIDRRADGPTNVGCFAPIAGVMQKIRLCRCTV